MLSPSTCWTPDAQSLSELIEEQLKPALDAFARFRATASLERSHLFREKQDVVGRVLTFMDRGFFAPVSPPREKYRVVAWNLERGIELDGQIDAFQTHPYLREADVILATETDLGMARSGNRAVAQDLAKALGYDFVFATCYLNLAKGAGVERDCAGENHIGLIGNAILSRYPLRNIRPVYLKNGKDKMSGREKRLGSENAIVAEVAFPRFPVEVACVHLDAHSTQRHRHDQMRDVLEVIEPGRPALVGGDWNTTTYDSSRALHSILGFWVRLLLGVDNVIRNHYLRPYNRFERELFALLEQRGYGYRDSNRLDGYTASYDINDHKDLKNLREWIPAWCVPFIQWALRNHGGKCPFKIDWFAARGLQVKDPIVLHEFREGRQRPLSDHDPICIDLLPDAVPA